MPTHAPLTNVGAERVRSVAVLARRAARTRAGLFLVEGPQGVREAVLHRPDLVRDVYVTEEAAARHPEILEAALASDLHVHPASTEVLAAMADTPAPQGLLAVCRIATTSIEDLLASGPRLLCLLTHVRDPGNAGTVLRAADAAGADGVIVSASSVDVFGPKTVRSTAGSLFHLPVVTAVEAAEAIAAIRGAGLRVLAADGAGDRVLPQVDLSGPHAWAFGNEAWGMPDTLRAGCDEVVRVPIHGAAESLNLAMAATVCLYASAFAHNPS